MAEKRMFSQRVIDSDAFLDMPLTAQALYFHLSMRADDDGFLDNPRKIQRVIGASADDLRLLMAKRYLIPFNSGVVVIRHWKIHNYIQKDRYHETTYQDEKKLLVVKPNREYDIVDSMDTVCIQNVSGMEAEIRLDKRRKDKNSIDKNSIVCTEPLTSSAPEVPALILNDSSEWYPSKDDLEGWQQLYVGVDVVRELSRMREWCKSNPTKRKTRKGIRRFVQSWLDREQNRPSKFGSGPGQRDKYTERMEAMKGWGKQFEDGNQS